MERIISRIYEILKSLVVLNSDYHKVLI